MSNIVRVVLDDIIDGSSRGLHIFQQCANQHLDNKGEQHFINVCMNDSRPIIVICIFFF